VVSLAVATTLLIAGAALFSIPVWFGLLVIVYATLAAATLSGELHSGQHKQE